MKISNYIIYTYAVTYNKIIKIIKLSMYTYAVTYLKAKKNIYKRKGYIIILYTISVAVPQYPLPQKVLEISYHPEHMRYL